VDNSKGRAGHLMDSANRSGPSVVRVADSFFQGLPPAGIDQGFVYYSQVVALPSPLIAGATVDLLVPAYPVRPSDMLFLASLEFFLAVPMGVTGYVDAPDDAARLSLFFEITSSPSARWSTSMAPGGPAWLAGANNGFDLLNRNVLTLFQEGPLHLLFPGGTSVRAKCNIANPNLPVAVGTLVGVRFAGRLIPELLWRNKAI